MKPRLDIRYTLGLPAASSRLRQVGDTIVYVPFYMPVSNAKWKWNNAEFADAAFAAVQRVNPAVTSADKIDSHVNRLRVPGFAAMIPPVQTPIQGLQIADTCFYYPEDRGSIAESVKLNKETAGRISCI